MSKWFEGRKLLVATKHGKESVIAPVVESALGVTCVTSDSFDTDVLGTFSGEISRKDDALTTLRNKCRMAMEAAGCDLVVATEGSFGPHPNLFFAPANDELMMLTDSQNGLEFFCRELTTETNFDGCGTDNLSDLYSFAQKAGFPEHALILKRTEHDCSKLFKGIRTEQDLLQHFEELARDRRSVWVETDMRAMHNPTRMQVIGRVAKKLANLALSECPVCTTPGFGIGKVNPGLPCGLCTLPTRATLSVDYVCKNCAHQTNFRFPDGKLQEDPTFCDICNP